MTIRTPRGMAAFAAAAAVLAAAPAEAGVFDTLFGRSATAASEPAAAVSKPGRRHWQLAEFTELRLSPREAGAALNEHPQVIPAAVVREWLQGVVLQRGTQREPLFGADELASLPPVIADALAVATPQDDLLLLSTSRRDGGLLGTPYGITARLFVQGGALQLVVQEARLDFYNQYRGARILPEFRFGSRGTPGAVQVSSPQAGSVRGDWLTFALGAPAAAQSQGAVPTAAPALPPATVAAPAATAPRPAVQPVPAAPAARDARFYDEQEQRLRSLKRLRDQNLLTEDEYQAKRKEILQAL